MTVPFGVRTYLPTLLKIARLMCNYIRRNESTIVKYLGEDGQALLDAVLVACDGLEIAIELVLPTDS